MSHSIWKTNPSRLYTGWILYILDVVHQFPRKRNLASLKYRTFQPLLCWADLSYKESIDIFQIGGKRGSYGWYGTNPTITSTQSSEYQMNQSTSNTNSILYGLLESDIQVFLTLTLLQAEIDENVTSHNISCPCCSPAIIGKYIIWPSVLENFDQIRFHIDPFTIPVQLATRAGLLRSLLLVRDPKILVFSGSWIWYSQNNA